jgi:hypothetical protein
MNDTKELEERIKSQQAEIERLKERIAELTSRIAETIAPNSEVKPLGKSADRISRKGS